MLESLISLVIKYGVPAIMGWLTGWISKVGHNIVLKNKAASDDKKAIEDAGKDNNTSGVFNG